MPREEDEAPGRRLSRSLALLVLIAALPLLSLAIGLLVWIAVNSPGHAPASYAAAAVLVIALAALWAARVWAGRIERDMAARAQAQRAAALAGERRRDIFNAVLSHEVRGALTATIGWLEAGHAHIEDAPVVRKALDIALRNARQQARIMDDLLDISRIVSGKFAIKLQPVELGRLAGEALEAARPAAEEKRIRLACELAEPVFVEGDRVRLLQVIGNLLGNAIKFTPPGGAVELRLQRRGGEAWLAVADEGIGIDARMLPHVFERYWQADSPEVPRGLGLGLPIVRHIVELHDGRVAAHSAGPGRGATFIVELPALTGEPPAAASARGGEEAEPRLNGLGVVALDRHEDTLSWLQHLFATHGAMTWTARSTEEALSLAMRTDADVLVSDAAALDDGGALISALRGPRAGRRIAAVAFSSQPTAEECERALAAGYDAFVAKPCEAAVLLRAVKAAVERAAA